MQGLGLGDWPGGWAVPRARQGDLGGGKALTRGRGLGSCGC